MCRPGHAPSRHPPTGGHTGPPLQREGEVPATTQASGAQRSVCAADGRKGLESRQRSSPKCPATSDNPSVTAAPCQLPLHKGAFRTGDADCRVASLLAMTVLILCHSEEAQRADVGIRSFLRWTGVRADDSAAPTGGCGKPPATAGAALSEAESAERAAGQIRSLSDDLFVQHGVPGSVAC